MTYNLSFNYCALLLLVTLFLIQFLSKRIPTTQNKYFTLLIFTCIGSTIFDILGAVCTMNIQSVPFFFAYLTNILYITFVGLVTFVYAVYSTSLLDNSYMKSNIYHRVFFFAPITVFLLCILSNPVTRVAFYYDESLMYHRGSLQPFFYIISFLYLIYGTWNARLFRHITNPFQKYAFYAFFVFSSCLSIFQMFFPSLLVSNFGISLCLLLIFYSLQAPEALLDTTTNILNAQAFSKMFQVYKKHTNQFSLVIITIEDITLLNQIFGFQTTNLLLESIASFLDSLTPGRTYYIQNAIYATILKSSDEDELHTFLTSVDERFTRIWDCGTSHINASVRMLCITVPTDASELDNIYGYADYLRTLDNSQKWTVFAKDISLHNSSHIFKVRNAIKNAIKNNSFMVFYHPIYSVSEHKITTAEALIRLKDAELGFVPPSEFIPLAEQDGSIVKIGECILESVCRFIHDSSITKNGIRYISVNLSVVQCFQSDMPDKFISILNKYNVDPSSIVLEITETVAYNSPRMLVKNLNALRSNGIHISLDDFGTGYSNINSLMNMPIDIIKFDKSMIDAATFSTKGKLVLGSSIAMIKRMDLRIIAEGIETQEQVDFLTDTNVDYLQGYYFSKPLNATDFVSFVTNFKPF